jgi:tRNA1(Val) A37 N6-methylase TrmN6
VEHSLDSIISSEFRFYQPLKGYRINIDTIILYDFASKYANGRVLEIGSASGVMSILLSKSRTVTHVTGIEIDPVSYGLSLKNRQINDCGERILFLNDDINNFKHLFKPQSFDTIITNPPFYKYGTGMLNKRQAVGTAHHDKRLTLDAVFKSARYLLKPRGYLIMLFTSSRIDEIFLSIKGFGVEVLRFIHRKNGKPADTFLMLTKKGGGKQLSIVPPLIVNEGQGYSEEVMEMLNVRV